MTPQLVNVIPSSGAQEGGDPLTLLGQRFLAPARVTFVSRLNNSVSYAALDVVVVSSVELTCVTPYLPAGAYDTYVTTPGGTTSTEPAGVYATIT